jgi:hypothetical protein
MLGIEIDVGWCWVVEGPHVGDRSLYTNLLDGIVENG